MLRKRGVVSKFVEFFGGGLSSLSIRRTAPSSTATCRRTTAPPADFFLVDDDSAAISARHRPRQADRHRDLVAAYLPRRKGMFRTKTTAEPVFTDVLKRELAQVAPSLAGPKRPQDRVALKDLQATSFATSLDKEFGKGAEIGKRLPVAGRNYDLGHGMTW